MPKLNKLYTRKQIDKIRQDLIDKHGNKCAICKQPRSAFKNSLSVDHNHKTKKLRDLLCKKCNLLVGLYGENIELLQSIIDYIKKHQENNFS